MYIWYAIWSCLLGFAKDIHYNLIGRPEESFDRSVVSRMRNEVILKRQSIYNSVQFPKKLQETSQQTQKLCNNLSHNKSNLHRL